MKLVKQKFERWLQTKKPDEIVGNNRDCCGCPIAIYYAEASKGHEVSISESRQYDGYVIDRGWSKRPAPWWASQFIFKVDGEADHKITAARALEIVARC